MFFPLTTSTKLYRCPLVTVGLIVANLAVFLATRDDLNSVAWQWGFRPADSANETLRKLLNVHDLETLVSHAFLHAGWAHLLGNMWMLAVFGAALEIRIGSLPFLIVYVLFGVVAVLCEAVAHSGPSGPCIGASGAISGVLGCFIALEPRSRVMSLFFFGIGLFLTEFPSLFYAAVWFVLQLDGIQTHIMGPDLKNIAWWAHVGGFAAGVGVGLAGRFLERYESLMMEDI